MGAISNMAMRGPTVTRWDLWLGGAAFCVVTIVGLFVVFADQIGAWWRQNLQLTSIAGLAFAWLALANRRFRRNFFRVLRALGDRIGVGEPRQLHRPVVLDGDTIEDGVTKIRYRLANIDAPEIGDNAKCHNERLVGERAKSTAIRLIAHSTIVSVRRSWRLDRHGRTVGYVSVDGADLGEMLMKQGLAARWRGRRMPWCGPNGPLVKLAELRGETLSCAACVHWRKL